MKHLKILLGIVFLFSFTFFSCEDDPCENKDCGDFGTCLEGDCICDLGYEVDADGACTVLVRDKFVGTYSCQETCQSGTDSYNVTISASPVGIDKIRIGNFYNVATTVLATVDGTNLTIEDQTTPDNFQVVGSGSITDNIINLQFTISDNLGNSENCTVVMTK